MKRLLTFIILVNICSFVNAQWFSQNPYPQANTINSIHFIDETGWMVGELGTILKTIDDGETWSIQSIGNNDRLNSVFFINENIGWITGQKSVYKTSDNGKTWNNIWSNLDYISAIYFVNVTEGWLVGVNGFIAHSTDGGLTWERQVSNTDQSLTGIQFIDSKTGFVIGAGITLLRTEDGGKSWIKIRGQTGPNFASSGKMFFLNENLGYIVWGNLYGIYKVTDLGMNWQKLHENFKGKAIFFVDENLGWASQYGQIFKTTDGGNTWIQNHSFEVDIANIIVTKSGRIICSGTSGKYIYSKDNGNTWYQNFSTSKSLYDIFFINKDVGWIAGLSVILNTTNGGQIWNLYELQEPYCRLESIFFIDENYGWAVGITDTNSILLTTENGGVTWTHKYFNSYLKSVHLFNNGAGLLAGIDSTYRVIVLHTSDNGESWSLKLRDDSNSLYWAHKVSMQFLDSLTGFLYAGKLYKTTDGGNEWKGYGDYASDGYFKNSQDGLIVRGYTVLKTTDGGNEFTENYVSPNHLVYLMDISFPSKDVGYIVGSEATILGTIDGGESWRQLFYPLNEHYNSVFFINGDIGWAAGSLGTILKTENGRAIITNIKSVPAIMVENYVLSQNYPNPFNPTTMIRYQISQTGLVSLKVYDILGREVATLVNEEKSAGEYGIEFNGNNISSGIYFYTLKFGKFTETKKLVLMR